MHTALTIAGSDSSGGAGIQADLKTMAAHHVYGMSAVTALTAQNTTGVLAVMDVPPAFLKAQLEAVFLDIYPDAVKVGMVSSPELIHVIAETLRSYKARNLVVDPVMVSSSGTRLMSEAAVETLKTELFAQARLITPNIPEAEALTGLSIHGDADIEAAAGRIYESYGCGVLLKGGHRVGDANDFLVTPRGTCWFPEQRVDNPNTHGTGCTLSSAIACQLAKGKSLEASVRAAKDYLTQALSAGLDLGSGSGPMDHLFGLSG